jgi:DnaK suppressor protein
MSNNNLAIIKKKLLARKLELEQELARLDAERVPTDNVQDPIDQAIQSSIEDLNISIEKNERDEYLRIIRALEMIDTGAYGICTDCGMPISEKRLQMYPNASRCIACQEIYENS